MRTSGPKASASASDRLWTCSEQLTPKQKQLTTAPSQACNNAQVSCSLSDAGAQLEFKKYKNAANSDRKIKSQLLCQLS
jgi:hypothetical protein